MTLATPDGIEPPYTESKSVVLPLNERAMYFPSPQYKKGSAESQFNLPLKKEMNSISSFYNSIVNRFTSLLSRTFGKFLNFFQKRY